MDKEKRLVPLRRFKTFKGEWKSDKIENISNVSQGLQIPISKRFKKNNENRHFYLTNEFLNKDSKTFYFIEKPPENYLCNKNDILMTRTGNTGIVVSNVEGAFHNNFFKIDFNRDILEKDFLVEVLRSYNVQKEILIRASGSTILDINHSDFYEITINFPCLYEQKTLAKFFKTIDNLIEIQKQKITKLKNLKSGYLNDMFPKEGESVPKLRFAEFRNIWKKEKLESLIRYEQPTNYIVKTTNYSDSYSIPVLTAGKSFLLGYTDEIIGVYKANYNNPVIIFDDFTTSLHYVDFKFKVKSSAMKLLTSTANKNNLYFLYNLLKVIDYKPESHERHWISIYSKFDVYIPCIKEQIKIGEFFRNLDNQIKLQESKLEKLKQMKQAYLNEMFV